MSRRQMDKRRNPRRSEIRAVAWISNVSQDQATVYSAVSSLRGCRSGSQNGIAS